MKSEDKNTDLNQLDALPVSLPASVTDTDGLAFSPDGKMLAFGDQEGTIQLYDLTHPLIRLPLRGLVDLVCEKVWRNLSLDEWHQFVSEDLPYERTCPTLPVHASLFETAEKLAKAGDQPGAIALLERAVELDSSLDLNPRQEVERWTKPYN